MKNVFKRVHPFAVFIYGITVDKTFIFRSAFFYISQYEN